MKAQYAILRFAKYKGPEIGHIEAHNERTKEKYASNPDVDTSRSHLNFHLVTPQRKYRAEAEKQIAEAGCRTRSDSVRVVEALVTASPEFFKGKKKGEIKAYFQEALDFMQKHQSKDLDMQFRLLLLARLLARYFLALSAEFCERRSNFAKFKFLIVLKYFIC